MKKRLISFIIILVMVLTMIPVSNNKVYAADITISDINIEFDLENDISLNTYWTHQEVNERVKKSVSASLGSGVMVDSNNTGLNYVYSGNTYYGIGNLLSQSISVEKEYGIMVELYPVNGYDWSDSVKAQDYSGMHIYANGVEQENQFIEFDYNAYWNSLRVTFSIGYADTTPIVANVSILELDCSMQKGATKQFSGVVNGSVSDKSIIWSVEGSTSANTVIDSTGLLSVGFDETATTLTVKATASANTEKTATVKVTVSGEVPYISSVSIGPAECEMYPGQTKQFSAGVYGTQEDKSVTWEIFDAESPDTKVSENGLVTVAGDETCSAFRVRVTAVQDTSKYAEATVNVEEKTIVNEVNLNNLYLDLTEFSIDVTEGEVNNLILSRLSSATTGVSVNVNNSGLSYIKEGIEYGIGDGTNTIATDKEYFIHVSLQLDNGFVWGPIPTFKVLRSGTDISNLCTLSYQETSDMMMVDYVIGKPCANHSYGSTTLGKRATSTEDGYYKKECSKCGHVEKTYIPKASNTTLSETSYSYDTKTHKPTVTVKDSAGKNLVQDTDYTVSYENSDSKLIGTYDVTVTFKGEYTGEITNTYEIRVPETTTAISKLTNTSSGIKVEWSKVDNALGYVIYRNDAYLKTITNGSTLSYSDTKAITSGSKYSYKIKVYYKRKDGSATYSKFSSTKSTMYIGRASVTLSNVSTGVKVSWKKITGANGYYVYREGKIIKTITCGSTVSYTSATSNENGTRYTFTVRAYYKESDGTKYLGAASTEKKIYFLKRQVIPSISSPSSSTVKVTCTKNSSATHYQFMYSRDKSFPASGTYKYVIKTYTVSSGTAKTITSLVKGKTYYFKVRSYKKLSDGTTNYGTWSAVKRVAVK